MKKCLGVLLSVLLLLSSVPMVAATYNDDEFHWGELTCDHSRLIEKPAVPSTCTAPGTAAYYVCADCHVLVGTKESLPLAPHTYDNDCDKECNECGFVREVMAHPYVCETMEATCTQDGKRVYTCACGDTYTEVIPATGHTPGAAADCENAQACTVCGEVLNAALGHNYKSVVTEPDCVNSGYTVHTCTVCGASYADSRVEALGHRYQLTEDVAPTCAVAGKKVYVCATCGDSYTEPVPATDHHTYDHDCDEDCNVCGYMRNDAHNYMAHYSEEPTCGEDGCEVYKCWGLFCGTPYLYITIPATGNHTYSGECDVTCDVCDQDRQPVVSHTYVLTEDVAVTCTADGKQVFTCQGCGDSYTETITAQGHTYHMVITKPDCENGGYTTHTCTACGDVCVDNRTDALGHEYDDDRDADCNQCGAVRDVASVPGDLNSDGDINNVDLALMQQYLNQWTVTIDPEAADVNNDGDVNNRDLALMQQYLNGWDIELV